MRVGIFVVCLFLVCSTMFGQGGTATINGTITDQAGAVVANATIEARNAETGVVYTGVSTTTGNYTISNVPVGTYALSTKVTGFKTYSHPNFQLGAGATVKEDITLQVGEQSEAVTVTGESTLLATETGDLATNVTLNQLDNLPLIGIGTANAGSSGIRNPFTLMQLIPGIDYVANSTMIVNNLGGINAPTEAYRIEGQDFTNHLVSYAVQEEQPSVDAIQEVAVQTSNYSAEFGTAGAAVINFTMKSGTNQYHGSVYDYFVNEDLNAGDPFSISGTPGSPTGGNGGKYRPRNRRNDFGGTMGGPVYIPKIYNGHDKTFFFWNYEEYIESNNYGFNLTVPTADYLGANFSHISPNGDCSLCSRYSIQTTPLGIPTAVSDAKGRSIYANTIYDPATRGVNPSNNLGYADPFPNNIIPSTRMLDPTALALEKLFPAAQNSNLTANSAGDILGHRYTTIPSIKIDEAVTPKDKLSFYYSKTSTEAAVAYPNGNADGLPLEIGAYRGTYIYADVYRLNYDRSITPTLLLHLGAGYWRENFGDEAPFHTFDPSQFGLAGFLIHRQFPLVTGMNYEGTPTTPGGLPPTTLGGMQNIGTAGQTQTLNIQEKPTYNANVTKVRGSHTYKAGMELYTQGTVYTSYAGVTLATGTGPTSQPFTPTVSLNGFGTGFGYASFLLGDYTSTTQTPQRNYRLGKYQYAMFIQDSWKVNRKLTLDYGIRWDIASQPKETYGRLGEFDPTGINNNAGGHPGATRFASTCNCDFYPHAYPYGIGPRVGIAYQIDPKTVFRGGWGLVYQFATDGGAGAIVSSTAQNTVPGINTFVNTQQPNFLLRPVWPVTDPSVFPALGTLTGAPAYPDRNYTRPPRINQWSAGFQREVSRNLVFEASYVGNHAVWLPGGPGTTFNNISPAQYAALGLYPEPGTGPAGYNNYADFQLLSQALTATAVKQKVGTLLPYAGYPAGNSNGLRNYFYPFPQFPGLALSGVANGQSLYNSLQIKGTKRLSHGLQASGTFSWARAFSLSGRQDFYNPASAQWELTGTDQPFLFNMNITYTTPKAAFLDHVKFANQLVKDWQIGAFTQYGSGSLIAPPTASTSNYLGSEFTRVAGQPLYNINPNSDFNPYFDQVLNPKAWANVPANSVGTAPGTYYTDFRNPRKPQENFNIGRNFRIKERMNLQFRGEFVNILNRTIFPNFAGVTPNPLTAPSKNSFGYYTSGFGVINAYSAPNSATFTGRTGTLILRFTF